MSDGNGTNGNGRRDASTMRALVGNIGGVLTARAIREYVRDAMGESIVKRMFDIGMGVETFETPTMAGNVVNVPASAAVQVGALKGLLQVGVPTQLGLVDDDGQTLPGVIALGMLDMEVARETATGGRFGEAAQVFSANGDEIAETAERLDSALRPMTERIAAGEFTVVEVDEGIGTQRRDSRDEPPPPIDEREMTSEQRILAKRKARRQNGG